MNKERLIQIFDQTKPTTEMSEQELSMAMLIMLSDDEILSSDVYELDEKSESYSHFMRLLTAFEMQVFSMRLKQLTTLRISLGAFIMLSQHFKSAGDAVMYAFYLCHKLPINTFVDASTVTSKLFPFGFFSNEQLNEMWDKQKVKFDDGLDECTCIGAPDNLLDYVEFWEK